MRPSQQNSQSLNMTLGLDFMTTRIMLSCLRSRTLDGVSHLRLADVCNIVQEDTIHIHTVSENMMKLREQS